jgi:hypothetical protein
LKKIIILVFAVISIATTKTLSEEPTIDLQTALEKGYITTTINGNPDSPHYAQPIILHLKNLKQQPLSIRIPNGLQLHSDSTDVQDLIVTQEELIALRPKEVIERPLYAMCTEQIKSASNENSKFSIGNVAIGDLAKLATEIERGKIYNTLGQYAIWTLTDDEHLNSISGFDMEEATRIKTFVANLLDVPVPEYDPNDYLTNYVNDGLIKRAATGKFRFRFISESAVTIAMFDEEDRVVRELYNDPNVAAGEHEMEFKFDVDVYQDKVYFVRMIVDGEIKINMKMEPRQG